MKYIILSDTHLGMSFPFLLDSIGISTRARDFYTVFDKVKDLIVEFHSRQEKVIVIIAGDFYHKINIIPAFRAITYEFLKNLAVQVIILGGNHDTTKNIDNPCSLDDLLLIPGVNVKRNIESSIIGDTGFVFLPFIRPFYIADLLVKKLGKAIDKDNIQNLAYIELTRKISKEIEKIKDCKRRIAITHYMIKGMNAKADELDDGGFTLPLEIFSSFDHVFAGHIHSPHEFSNVVVLGSTEYTRISEIGEKKRFIIYDDSNNTIESVELKPRKHVIIGFEYKGEDSLVFNKKIQDEAKQIGIKNAVVRFQIRCKGEERAFVNGNFDYNAYPEAFYVHTIELKEEGSEIEKNVELNLFDLSFKGNLDSYAATFIDKAFHREFLEKGNQIIASVLKDESMNQKEDE